MFFKIYLGNLSYWKSSFGINEKLIVEVVFVGLIHLRMRCLISGNIFITILENLAIRITSDFVSLLK